MASKTSTYTSLDSHHAVESKDKLIASKEPLPSTTLPFPLLLLPSPLHPYLILARLNNPAGSLFFWLPHAWSFPIAARALHLSPWEAAAYMGYFLVGSVLYHCIGCTWNDMIDVDLDRQVERTKSRPLPSGALSMLQASCLLALECALYLPWAYQTNYPTFLLALASFPLLAIYPFCKRWTYWPQAVLGAFFNWGAIIGYSSLAGSPNWPVVGPLWAAGICWTIVYDTIYAHQDKKDDVRAGIKSTALLFGDYSGPILAIFVLGMMASLAAVGWTAGLGTSYYVLAVGGSGAVLGGMLWSVDWEDMESCWAGFKQNVWVGLLVAAGVWAEYLWDWWVL